MRWSDGRRVGGALCLLALVACGRPAPDDTGKAPPAPEVPSAPAAPDAPQAVAVPGASPADSAPTGGAVPESPAVAPAAPTATAPAESGATAAPARPPTPAPGPAAPEAPVAREAPVRPSVPRDVMVPAGTALRLTLDTAVSSDGSAVEDRVMARVASAVRVDGATVVPEGARVGGEVTYVKGSAKVKGRAALTVRFRTITIGGRTYDLEVEPLRREARGTKAKDARDIGIGAGAGAVIGGIIGGRKGAGIGAAVGGAGGTGVVLATKGEEVRLPAGTPVTTRLEAPLVVEMRATGPPR